MVRSGRQAGGRRRGVSEGIDVRSGPVSIRCSLPLLLLFDGAVCCRGRQSTANPVAATRPVCGSRYRICRQQAVAVGGACRAECLDGGGGNGGLRRFAGSPRLSSPDDRFLARSCSKQSRD